MFGQFCDETEVVFVEKGFLVLYDVGVHDLREHPDLVETVAPLLSREFVEPHAFECIKFTVSLASGLVDLAEGALADESQDLKSMHNCLYILLN